MHVHHTKNYQGSLLSDAPYKAGMYIHHTKNYRSLLTLHANSDMFMRGRGAPEMEKIEVNTSHLYCKIGIK